MLSDLAPEPSAIIYSSITIGGMEIYLHCHSAKRLGSGTVSHHIQQYNHRRNGNKFISIVTVQSDLAPEPSAIIYSSITIGGMEIYLHCHSAKRLGSGTVSHHLQQYNHRRNGNKFISIVTVQSDLAPEPSAIIYSSITIGGMEIYLHCHSAKRLGSRTVSHNLQQYNHRRNGNLSPLSQCKATWLPNRQP